MKCAVTTLDKKDAGEIDLDDSVFGAPVRRDILARMVNWQLAKRRAGTHKTKGRSEVRGSTRKLFNQKGTGRARAGSARVSQRRGGGVVLRRLGPGDDDRGGGVVFGPLPRDHGHKLPKKVRRLALKSALSAKAAEGKLVVLDGLGVESGKTKDLARRIAAHGWSSVLVIAADEYDEGFARAVRNIHVMDVLPHQGANVYDILRSDTLALTKDAARALEARLK